MQGAPGANGGRFPPPGRWGQPAQQQNGGSNRVLRSETFEHLGRRHYRNQPDDSDLSDIDYDSNDDMSTSLTGSGGSVLSFDDGWRIKYEWRPFVYGERPPEEDYSHKVTVWQEPKLNYVMNGTPPMLLDVEHYRTDPRTGRRVRKDPRDVRGMPGRSRREEFKDNTGDYQYRWQTYCAPLSTLATRVLIPDYGGYPPQNKGHPFYPWPTLTLEVTAKPPYSKGNAMGDVLVRIAEYDPTRENLCLDEDQYDSLLFDDEAEEHDKIILVISRDHYYPWKIYSRLPSGTARDIYNRMMEVIRNEGCFFCETYPELFWFDSAHLPMWEWKIPTDFYIYGTTYATIIRFQAFARGFLVRKRILKTANFLRKRATRDGSTGTQGAETVQNTD